MAFRGTGRFSDVLTVARLRAEPQAQRLWAVAVGPADAGVLRPRKYAAWAPMAATAAAAGFICGSARSQA